MEIILDANKLNKEYVCKRISLSLGRGTYEVMRHSLDRAGIKNRSKWLEQVILREAKRIADSEKEAS